MQVDATGSMDDPTVPDGPADVVSSPLPVQRQRSSTATAAEKMRSVRSSSRVSHSTPSKHGDDDSSKTAVKVGECYYSASVNCATIADPIILQLSEYDHLSNPPILAMT